MLKGTLCLSAFAVGLATAVLLLHGTTFTAMQSNDAMQLCADSTLAPNLYLKTKSVQADLQISIVQLRRAV